MPQTPSSQPKSPVVVGSGKDPEKGFYRDIRMPNGVLRREWTLFSEETKKRRKSKEDEFNNKVGWASKPSLTKVGGAMMATGAAMGAGAVLLAKKTPDIAKNLAAKEREKARVNPVVKRAGRITSKLEGRNQRIPGTTKGQIDYYREMSGNQTGQRGASFAGRKGARPAPNRQMTLTREQYNARLNPRLGGQSSSLLGGQSSPSLRGQSSSFTPSTAAQREAVIQAMQQRKYGSPLQGQSTDLTAVREEAIQAMQQRKYGSPLQGQTSPLPARGSTMPQTGNLFDQPEPPKTRAKGGSFGPDSRPKSGNFPPERPGARFRPRESGQVGVGRPGADFRPVGKGNKGPNMPKTQMGQGIAVNRNPKSAAELKAIEDAMRRRSAARAGTGAPGARFRPGPVADSPGAMRAESAATAGKPRATLRPVANPTKLVGKGIAVNRNPIPASELKAVEDAVNRRRAVRAGTAAPSARFRPGPVADSPGAMRAESAATAGRPRATFRPVGSGPKPTPPTPQFGPTPTGTKPYVPPGQSAIPTFTTTAPKSGGIGGFFKGVGRVLSNPMVAVASAIDAADKATNFRRIPYTGNFGGPSFAKNPYASTSGNPDAKPAGKKETTAPAATAPAPAQSGGNKPSGGQKPYEPRYFPEAGGNGNAVRKPDSYLGEAFDYSLQKGTTSGSKYLEHMFRRDKVSEDDQQRLRERFNKKVVGDQTLQEYGADKGITQTLEGKKSGLGEALLGKYRDTGTYQGNTKYDVMRSAAEARMARK